MLRSAGLVVVAGAVVAVRVLAFAPDGTLISISWDHTIRLWDLASRQQRGTIDTDPEDVPGAADRMAVSSTGHIAGSGFTDTVVVWSLATGQPIARLAGHTGFVNAVAFSPDGRTLASAGMDNTVRLWDTTSYQQTDVLDADTSDGLTALAWSPDGTLLAIGDSAGRAWLHGDKTTTLSKHDGGLDNLAFSPDGRLLAGCGYGGRVPVWDVTGRRRVATLPGTFTGVRGVAFSPDGRTLATGTDDNTVRLWNLADRRHFATLTGTGPGHAVMAVAYSPDGTLIAAASADKTVRLWAARS